MALVLAACGAPRTQSVVVTTNGFRYVPSTVEVTAGQPVRLTLRNPDAVEHDFIIDKLPSHSGSGAHQAGMDHPGGEEGVHIHAPAFAESFGVFTPTEKGTYTVYCSLPGHKEQGMTASLVVR
jgi:uncharacterized cupredoxin-like copper-binding protein